MVTAAQESQYETRPCKSFRRLHSNLYNALIFWDGKSEKKEKKKSSKGKGLYSDLAAVCSTDERRTPQNKPKHFKDESVRQTLATKNVNFLFLFLGGGRGSIIGLLYSR